MTQVVHLLRMVSISVAAIVLSIVGQAASTLVGCDQMADRRHTTVDIDCVRKPYRRSEIRS